MRILLGLSLADPHTLPAAPVSLTPTLRLAPAGLVRYLESFYALGSPAVNRQALRTEQYRQLLTLHAGLATTPPFYSAAFRADEFATAEELLGRRDELLEAGYYLDRDAPEGTPDRIATLHELEALLLDEAYELCLMAGYADRVRVLLGALEEERHPRLEVLLNEPRASFPPGARRLLDRLESLGSTVASLPDAAPPVRDNDLGRWQRTLRGEAVGDAPLRGDGSLVLLRAQRETHIAAYIARCLRDNPDWRPGALLTVRNQTLDNAILMEGLPSLGVPSTSLARPSLQVLKLVTAFLWQPIEIDRVMEFVSLVHKPLHWRLAERIGRFLADTPGMFGGRWVGMIEGFFEEMKAERNWPDDKIEEVRRQYRTWFQRTRYERSGTVPKDELRRIFLTLRQWALDERKELRERDERRDGTPGEYGGLLSLAAQSQRAVELLDAQPEGELNFLAVERLVRTIYEPAPTRFQEPEQGALSITFAPASALKNPDGGELERLLWWDFIEHEPDYFFSRYYPDELSFLAARDVSIDGPVDKNQRLIWQQQRPVLHARNQVVLCLPERVDGTLVEPHPLLGDLEAAFPEGSLAAITVNIDAAGEAPPLSALRVPTYAPVPIEELTPPRPHLTIGRLATAPERDFESPSSLDDLLYYPHKWVFRHQLKLKKTPILSIASENRLRGNLSHLFVERVLRAIDNDREKMTKSFVHDWIDANWERLLSTQGAVLLEYGQEPERVQFVRTMKYAAWSLVHHIKENGWTIRGTEERVRGELDAFGQPMAGRADLTLCRDKHGKHEVVVVDLKWRGKTAFGNLLRNNKDIQLCLYAEFIRQNLPLEEGEAPAHRPPDKVHTAYYVLQDALMLGRNELAFAGVETVTATDEAGVVQEETLRKIRTTYNWRWEQFREGLVEVRSQDTIGHLEDLYLELDHGAMLEMETDDARFDDYATLIGRVR